jgi:hypothetical protein
MKKLRNEVTYAIGCSCQGCRKASGRDFEVIGSQMHHSLKEAREELKTYRRTSQHSPTFLVRETLEPVHQIPQLKPKARKEA